MPDTYATLQQKITKLKQEAEAVRAQEVSVVISRIKEAIEAYGFEPSDLFDRSAIAPTASTKTKSERTVMYADGKGGEWVGRGPRPLWLRDALANGHSLDEFRVG